MVPFLAQDIPTVANGGVSADLTTITWKLKDGLKWADGSPVTAADAVFTWKYCSHPEGGCAQSEKYNDVTGVEAVDDSTIKVTSVFPSRFPTARLSARRHH